MLLFAPNGWPLLKKGVNPFRGILQKEIARHGLASDVVGCPEGTIDLSIECLLAEADHDRAARQNDIGELCNFCVQPAGGDDAVDEPPGKRGGCVDGLTSEEHLHGAFSDEG